MKTDFKTYGKLFANTFTLSAFTFGGGYVIVPLMKKRFVDKLGWLEESEMLDLTAIAQSCPGPIAVNASILVGYRIGGVLGSFIALLGTVTPPLVILSVISMFYAAFRDSAIVGAVLRGMQAGVAAVICDVVINMGSTILKKKHLPSTLIMIAAFAAAYIFKINVAIVIISCALIGVIMAFTAKKEAK